MIRNTDPRRAAMDTALIVGAVLLAWLLTWQGAVPAMRIVGGLALAFVFPGFAITSVLFPGPRISRVERVVVSAGMSLGLLVIGGILVYLAGARLTMPTWSTLTAAVSVALTIAGHVRWRGAMRSETDGADEPPADGTPAATPGRAPSRWRTAGRLAPLLVAVVLLSGASWIGWHSATSSQGQAPFTALSMIPDDDANITDQVRPVTIAVDCRETGATSYILHITGITRTVTQYTFRLVPGEVWKQQLQVPANNKVTAELYRNGDTTPYRTVFVSGQTQE